MVNGPQLKKERIKRPQTTIKMEPEVAEYLALLSDRLQRDRTFLINAIILEHARKHGGKLPPPQPVIPM